MLLTLQEKVLEAVQEAITSGKVAYFEHDGHKAHAYPGEAPNIVEARWDSAMWADLTAHCM